MKKDAGNRPGSVRGQVGGLREGPLVSLCAQAEPVDLRREKIVQDEHDRFRTALQVELLQYRINRYALLAGGGAADFQASRKRSSFPRKPPRTGIGRH